MIPSSQRCDSPREKFDGHDETNSPLTSCKPFHIHTWLRYSTMVKKSVVNEAARRRCL
jgi:hypothetical protein